MMVANLNQMNSNFLLALLIILCLVQYSAQDNNAEVRSVSGVVNKPINSVAFPNNYYGRLPIDWNHDGVIDWRDQWGWNKECNQQWGWNRGWREPLTYGWDEPRKSNWRSAPTGSIVSRRLGAKYDTSLNLKNHLVEQNSLSRFGEQAIYNH